ncbi:hypothetical protein [Pseudomonas sp. DP-17]|uniref:hypothetical protein n=1 Tax=Pseudomonas sp. DP-17 TaxID=1580486 RepID=UPI001EFA62FE|nr:hypothetical protein [Pseudomonas sp. DP-17]MCG8911034.1 hypothetical protein [Pseudomonas sp. DP-17]
MQTSVLEYHPFANIFPLLSGADYDGFKADVQEQGQLEPIILLEGKILDGRNRYRVCLELGMDPITKDFEGDDPLAFVVALNLRRRHLTTAQRALIAVELAKPPKGDSDATEQSARILLPNAAKTMNVSPRSVSSAKRVMRDGAPKLVSAVKNGEVSISIAEQLVKLPIQQQDELCDRGAKALRLAAQRMKQPKDDSVDCFSQAAPEHREEPQPEKLALLPSVDTSAKSELSRKPSALLLFELADSGMQEGREAASVVEEILDAVDEGLDLQLLAFTTEVAVLLRDRIRSRVYRR